MANRIIVRQGASEFPLSCRLRVQTDNLITITLQLKTLYHIFDISKPASTMTDRPEPLRLGSTAPNFDAETTAGPINFHEFITKDNSWVVLFSHPEDYTPGIYRSYRLLESGLIIYSLYH